MSSISYTLPVHRDASIGRALRRLIEIKRQSDEIIVCDQGSPREIIDVERRYADKVVQINEFDTIPAARNAAALEAKGEILVSMDPDVIVPGNTPNRLEEAFKEERAVAAACDVYVYPWEQTPSDRVFCKMLNLRFKLGFFLGRPEGRGEFQAFRRTAFQRIGGYNDRLYAGEDSDVLLRISRIGKVVYLRNFEVYESPRRYRVKGHIRTGLLWAGNSLRYYLGIPITRYERVPKN